MINRKTIISAVLGLVIGAGAMAPIAYYQYEKRGEVAFYLDALIGFIDQSPECTEALDKL